MSKILVTGVAGLLGSHFSRHLLKKDHTVIGVDDFSGGYRDFVDPRVILIEGNLVDESFVKRTFVTTKPDYVYHFAAYAAVGLSPFIRTFNYKNNVVASANVINGCINNNVKKVIFASSMDVYGPQDPPFTESMIPWPEDPYGIAKFTVEQDLAAASRLFGIKYSVVRPHNVFGIYQNIWDKYRNVIGIWIRKTLSGEPISVYGDGSQIRSFSDVKYYMEPFEKLMTLGDGETYNLGADSYISIIDAAQKFQRIAREFGYNPDIVHFEPRDEVDVAYCEHTKAKNDLNFKDETSFEELVRDMFVWAMDQPDRAVKTKEYEVEKKMYSYWR